MLSKDYRKEFYIYVTIFFLLFIWEMITNEYGLDWIRVAIKSVGIWFVCKAATSVGDELTKQKQD